MSLTGSMPKWAPILFYLMASLNGDFIRGLVLCVAPALPGFLIGVVRIPVTHVCRGKKFGAAVKFHCACVYCRACSGLLCVSPPHSSDYQVRRESSR